MSLIRSSLRQAKIVWLRSLYRKPVSIVLDNPIVSMTFDDVPLSAYQFGVPILNQRNIKATFYVALNIESCVNRQHLGPSEIQELHERGHEIGCHTFSHYSLLAGNLNGFTLDAEKNRAQLTNLLGENNGPRSFSFPFGHISLTAKKKLQGSYQSMRSSGPGINHGSTDLNCLKAYSLGVGNSTQAYISELLDKAERKNGWLIFYTHGVSRDAGRYDILPETLETILLECDRRRIEILPVARAVESISNN